MQWKYLYALPLSYFLYCQLSSFGGIDFKQSNCEDFILLLLLNTFAYLAYLAVLNMILESYDVYKWNERVNLMGKQLAMQKGQYEKLTKNMEETARLRHDWRHHLLLIRKYTEERDLVGLEHYLESYFEESTDEEEVPVCSNHSVDIILRHYIALAKQKGISMGVSVDIPDNLKILDYHLCIVFGNLVENAVENCVKQENQPAFVRVKAKPVGEQLAIIVENSYDGEILMDGEEFLSTKHKGGGIGISSVRSIAEEHGGSFRISYEDHVFKVFVLFSA
ncbi:MAG: ATP-binding protein [Anaerovorax sp.]